jgi:sulfite reductase (ferredoxin)
VEFLRWFESSGQYPDFAAYLAANGRQVAAGLSRRYANVPEFAQDKNYYFDWGAEDLFSLAGRAG